MHGQQWLIVRQICFSVSHWGLGVWVSLVGVCIQYMCCFYSHVFGPVVAHHSWPPLALCFSLGLCLSFSFSDDATMSLIPQFGTSFATFRPALSHSGSTRPLSVILPVPASPPYNRPPGSSSSSPTSKVPIWKVCSQFASISSVTPFLLFLFHTFQLVCGVYFF